MERGDYWLFGREHIGPHNGPYKFVLADYPIARAVAASICFPPVMDPQVTDFWSLLQQVPPHDASQRDQRAAESLISEPRSLSSPGLPPLHPIANHDVPEAVKQYLTSVHLTDGGVFDNNAIEAVWPYASFIVVSDAGGPFQVSWQSRLLWRLQRYQAITSNVARSSQTRWLATLQSHGELSSLYISTKAYGPDHPEGASASGEQRYPEPLRRTIARIRSDLDAFTEGEICILENHGYCEAAHALQHMAPTTIAPRRSDVAHVPWKLWMDPERVGTELQQSHRTMIQGHLGWRAFLRDRMGARSRSVQ
jgi:NTE family protein